MSLPTTIDGDSPGSAICTSSGGACGNKDSFECSGGYPCNEETTEDNDNTDYKWPPGVPFPDDPNKVPDRCNAQPFNFGRQNDDQKLSLSTQDVTNQTTKPWGAELKFGPTKPTVISAKL